MRMKLEITPEMTELLVKSGSMNYNESVAAMPEVAKALVMPLRQGVFSADNLDGIFEEAPLPNGAVPEFPLDPIAPGTEKDWVAFTMPNHGRIPEMHLEGDYVMINTYDIAGAVDWLLKYARDARWDIVGRAMEAMRSQFVKKLNDDGWHTLISAAADRNIVVFDSDAGSGQFTKRLVTLASTVMRRNGGGNSTSTNRGLLTDIYLSPEGLDDIRNWGVDQVDEITRREIYTSAGGRTNAIFGVNLHDMDELGEGQEYQNYAVNTATMTLPTGNGGDVEFAFGLDLRRNDSFIMPTRGGLEIFDDPTLHRQKRAGVYGWREVGFGALDNRRVIALSY